ncbi:hypothetical protein [Haloarchaeobius sp. TZWSO28]|uniref:DUF7845 domain-containing protein n=1 Tax=Haloarchaeobius sp. TZWSO28 TaxID=3446119 RepID=UPI003EB89972
MTGYIEPASHEFVANYLFDTHGLAPFFAADSEVKSGGGSQRSEFLDQGERWTVTLYYQDSNIVHPGSKLPTGTDWRLDAMHEFRLRVERHEEEDPIGQQSFNAHLTPRWQGMKTKNNDGTMSEYSVPPGNHEAVNVKIPGSNIDFKRYTELLQSAALAVGIRADYFADPHEYSNVQDAERYWRNSPRCGRIGRSVRGQGRRTRRRDRSRSQLAGSRKSNSNCGEAGSPSM